MHVCRCIQRALVCFETTRVLAEGSEPLTGSFIPNMFSSISLLTNTSIISTTLPPPLFTLALRVPPYAHTDGGINTPFGSHTGIMFNTVTHSKPFNTADK